MGSFMKWMRGSDTGKVFERLDRGVVYSDFFVVFPMVCEIHSAKDSFDHLPVLFNFNSANLDCRPKEKLFHLKICGWDVLVGRDMAGLFEKIESCGMTIDTWNKSNFGSMPWSVCVKQVQLKRLLCNDDLDSNIDAINDCQKQL